VDSIVGGTGKEGKLRTFACEGKKGFCNKTDHIGRYRPKPLSSKTLAAHDPRRPDFMEVAGGLPVRTGGLGTCC
jgi:hypothetical protein